MDNYANAKAKLMEYTKPSGICVINKDDEYANLFISKAKGKVLTYAIENKSADIFATDNYTVANWNADFNHLLFKHQSVF